MVKGYVKKIHIYESGNYGEDLEITVRFKSQWNPRSEHLFMRALLDAATEFFPGEQGRFYVEGHRPCTSVCLKPLGDLK